MRISKRIKKNFRKKLAALIAAGMMTFSLGTVDAAEVVNITLAPLKTTARLKNPSPNAKELFGA